MIDYLPSWLIRTVAWLSARSPWLASRLSALSINRIVSLCRHRPHPWSTVHEYISWSSLTDQRYSARHLPPFQASNLPDATEAIAIFKREDGEQELCEKSTCLFPAFAQYLTDGFIRTRMPNTSSGETDEVRRQNTSNHQIDLCPLYGRTTDQTNALRLRGEEKGTKGRLKSQFINGEEYAPFLYGADGAVEDEFKDLDPPLGIDNVKGTPLLQQIFAFGGDRTNAVPQVAMLNTLLLREHNRLAERLESENPSWDDERVFQTARIILTVIFIKIVVEEYINHIAPLPFRVFANAAVAQRAAWNKPNWITTEFSLLYRWHSLIPDQMSWGGRKFGIMQTSMNNALLLDVGLANAFAEISSQRAGKLTAFNTAAELLNVEKSAIIQGRVCSLAPYGAYRKYVSLKAPTTFDDISSNPKVAPLLSKLYAKPEDVEFYVGLFAEDTVANSPLPPLILRMVAVDAFSQAMTNPLLSEHVHNEGTFTPFGWRCISETRSISDLVQRNVPHSTQDMFVGMTRPSWSYSW